MEYLQFVMIHKISTFYQEVMIKLLYYGILILTKCILFLIKINYIFKQ